MVLQKNCELGQRPVEVSLFGVLDGQPVARKRVLWILCQNFVQCGDAVHWLPRPQATRLLQLPHGRPPPRPVSGVELVSVGAAEYNSHSRQIRHRKETRTWPAPISRPKRNCKVVGLIRQGFLWGADGRAIAPPLVMAARFLPRACWRLSAISATPAVAVGRHRNATGMPSASPFPLRNSPVRRIVGWAWRISQ